MTMTKTDPRGITLDILLEVLEEGRLGHLVLNQALLKYQYLEKQDRSFITKLTEGTLERLILLDAALDRFSKTKTEKMKPVIRTILRMSAYQILFMDRVPDAAVCNEAVKLAKKRKFQGLSGFVNGVLRTLSREKGKLEFMDPSVRFSIPGWMLSMWEADYGKEKAEQIAASFLKERPLTVRFNTSRASAEEILKSLESQGIAAEPTGFLDTVYSISGYDHLEAVEAFYEGLITVQDPSSALAAHLAGIKAGDTVLDICSAPGGKTLHAADLLKGTGRVEARDLTEYKISLVEQNLFRCGFANVETKVWDARIFDPEMEEKADVVLADLPCSGLGIIGKKPDIKLRLKKEDLGELASLQREILSAASRYVKPGGTLLYSTCTVDRAENEENAAWILENLPFHKKEIAGRLPGSLQADCRENQIQLLPGIHGCDGFFLAAFEKNRE